MAQSIQLPLTNELWAFLDEQSGEGTPYATPGDFVRALICERQVRQQEAADVRAAVLEGYDDARRGRMREYTGDLRTMLESFRDLRCRDPGSQR